MINNLINSTLRNCYFVQINFEYQHPINVGEAFSYLRVNQKTKTNFLNILIWELHLLELGNFRN